VDEGARGDQLHLDLAAADARVDLALELAAGPVVLDEHLALPVEPATSIDLLVDRRAVHELLRAGQKQLVAHGVAAEDRGDLAAVVAVDERGAVVHGRDAADDPIVRHIDRERDVGVERRLRAAGALRICVSREEHEDDAGDDEGKDDPVATIGQESLLEP